MDMLLDPTMLGALKVVGAAIGFLMAIPFIVGLVLGYIVGHRT